jgi:hypothetical protein
MKRNRRAGVEDRWRKTIYDDVGNPQTVPSARYGKGLRWLARMSMTAARSIRGVSRVRRCAAVA